MTGWCVYDDQVADPQHVAAVIDRRPEVVRWFVSIDRWVRGAAMTVDWSGRVGAALDAIAASGSRLVVQLQMKRPDWTAGDADNTVGCAAWRQSRTEGWLSEAAVPLWCRFVERLAAELDRRNIVAWWGCWNEPDWRLDWPWRRPRYSNASAPVTPWTEGRLFGLFPIPPSAPFGWSGGAAKLTGLRQRFPELTWTSDGVGAGSAEWLAAVAADPTIGVIDVHTYHGRNLADVIGWSRQIVHAFDDARTERLPIVVGEYGDHSSDGTPVTPEWRDRLYVTEAALEAEWPGRVVGVATHVQGARYPALWQV